jgi:peptidoglycan/LPS O-acetylase OafA/YrhL
MVFALACVGLLALAKHLALEESREAVNNTDDPSRGGRIALGFISAAIGLVVIGTAVSAAIHATDPFTSERIIAIPAGLIFVLGGALVALPPGSRRWQSVLSALLVTCFAVTFDWVAFGPGERKFGGGVSLGLHVGAGFPVGEFIGRAVFGVVAIVLDIFAIIVWISHCRRLLRPKTDSDT